MDSLKKTEITSSIRHIARFLKSEIDLPFRSPEYRKTEKQQEEEHRQLQSVLRHANATNMKLIVSY